MPANTPKVNWEVINADHETVEAFPVVTKHLLGHVDNSSYPAVTVDIQLTLTTPASAAGPVPVIMELSFVFRPGPGAPPMPAPTAPS